VIVETVGLEINRLVELFLSRNPAFRGSISLAGHSLGKKLLSEKLQIFARLCMICL
jgi:hypothetical protein